MRTLLLILSLLVGSSWANTNGFPHSEIKSLKSSKELTTPGYCQIEIVNHSNYVIRVFGVFDDGEELRTFRMYPHEYPHYISLFYYGYCHYGMNLDIETLSGYRIYSGYTRRYDTVFVN